MNSSSPSSSNRTKTLARTLLSFGVTSSLLFAIAQPLQASQPSQQPTPPITATPTVEPTFVPTELPIATPTPAPLDPTATPQAPAEIPTIEATAVPTELSPTVTLSPTETVIAMKSVSQTMSIGAVATPTSTLQQVAVNDDPMLVSIKTIANPRAISSWGGSTQLEANPRAISSWGGPSSDGFRKNQQAFASLGLDRASTLANGEGMIVAVLDTGFQLDHPMLANSFTNTRYDFVSRDPDPTDIKDGIDNDGNKLVDEAYGHGTHIAGIIHLIAPNAKIMPLRILSADGDGNMANLVAAIDFASQNGAKIINVSLGATSDNTKLHAALQRAYSRGSIVVGAAGNLDLWPRQYPAADNCAIAVTSSGQLQSFVNNITHGAANWIDFAAPGENIYSTFPGSTYATWSGSSMASPIVSAIAALVRSRYPNASPKQVLELMNATSDTIKGGFLFGLLKGISYEDVSRVNAFMVTYDGNFITPYLRRSPDAGNSLQNGDSFYAGRFTSALNRGIPFNYCQ